MKIHFFNEKANHSLCEKRSIFTLLTKIPSFSGKKMNLIIVLLLITSFVLEAFNIHFANKLATNSIHASKIQKQIEQLEHKNLILRSEILKYTSYELISSHAAEMGFVEPKDVISLYRPLNVAVSR